MSSYCMRTVLAGRLLGTSILTECRISTSVLNHCQACLQRGPGAPSMSVSNGPMRRFLASSTSDPTPSHPVGGSTTDSQNPPTTPHTGDSTVKNPQNIVIKVQQTNKTRPKIDFSLSYTENVYMTPVRAMTEYLVDYKDLEGLPTAKRRSPYRGEEGITVYPRREVEKKAIAKWGSLERLNKMKSFIKQQEFERNARMFYKKEAKKGSIKEYSGQSGEPEKPFVFDPVKATKENKETIFKSGSGKVVVCAIVINGMNALFKLGAWLYTGSHSLFAEFIHSMADTANQIILAVGLHQSMKAPDLHHPYGWASFRNVSSLVSGVGIFCVGAGLSWYHGIIGLAYPGQVDSLFWAIAILGGSFVSEGATLIMAVNQIRSSAVREKMTFWQYVWGGRDPSTNVVLMEDMAAVVGVAVAAGCMGLSAYYPIADPMGSLVIGTLLGGVASFIIYTNTIALVGKSIPPHQRQALTKELEDDRMIRALHDVKATDMGGSYVRFKAEVDFDGREITRLYLEKQDLALLLQDMNKCSTVEDVETFFLKHGENIVDILGAEVDRIEKNLKEKHPEIRHVDLEQL